MSVASERRPADETRSARRGRLELLLVLALAWLALGANSLSKRDVLIFGVSLANPDIEGYLRAPRASEESAARTRAAAFGAFAAAPAPAEAPRVEPRRPVVPAALRVPDRAPQRILIFGDSLVKALAPRLSDYAAANGHELHAASWYGSTTIAWAVNQRLDDLLARHDPTFVIVVLGASEVPNRDVAGHEKFVRRIVEKIGARKLAWIGPPNIQPDTGINDIIERVVGADHFFRSAGLELPRYGDHIHPTAEGGRTWMDLVARWLADESAVPILLDAPSRPGPPPDLVIFQQAH
jgi:lysophospholipase L1-like esterase